MSLKAHLPNLVTGLNLLCGCIAVIFAVYNYFAMAALFVGLGIFFDFFDGLIARKLNVQSALGIQLDSLADLVTSGLVPGIVMFKMLSMSIEAPVMATNEWSTHNLGFIIAPLALVGFLITLASAYRLAKFNLDEDQQTYFKGLPTPANALCILSLPLIVEFQGSALLNSVLLNTWVLVAITLGSAYLLNSSIKLFALKFKTWGLKKNGVRYLFIGLCVLLLGLFKFMAIPMIVVIYIILSLFFKPTN